MFTYLTPKVSNWVRTEFPSPGAFATVTTTSIARERISVTCLWFIIIIPKGKIESGVSEFIILHPQVPEKLTVLGLKYSEAL